MLVQPFGSLTCSQQWQAREIEEDLSAVTAKAARAWEKQCRKYVKQSKGGRLGGDKKPGRFAVLVARGRTRKPGKGKTREGQPEEEPSEKNKKPAALKQRLAAIKEKRSKKQKPEDTDPAEKQSKKEKAQKAAGVIFFPVILILGIPILIGKGIASGFKKVRGRKTKTDGDAEDTQEQQPKASRRAAVKHRLSERGGSVKQGLSTRSDAIKKRLAERKAKKAEADGATTTPTSPDGQTGAASQIDAEDAATQTRTTKLQRLTGLLVAGPLAVNAALEKRRKARENGKTTTEDSTPNEKKASKFAGVKERVKSLRTKVNKQTRFAKLKARLRARQERRKNKRNVKKNATDNDTAQVAEADDGNNATSVKKHGAIAGLVAGCVALPAAKVKQARDKRRKDKAADSMDDVAAAARGEHANAINDSSVAGPAAATVAEDRESASSASRPSGLRLVPSEPEMLEPAAERFSPPQNGQSEVPIQQAARTEPDVLPGTTDGDIDVAAAASGGGEQHAESPAAAVRFKSIRDGFGNVRGGIGSGITNLKARRRGTGQTEVPMAEETHRPQAETMDSAETHVEATPSTVEPMAQSSPAQQETAASGGRFKSITGGIGSGIDGFKARRQREKKEVTPQAEGPAATSATEDENRAAVAANKDTASSGGRLKALKDGIGSRGARSGENGAKAPVKTEKSKQQKQQVHKVGNSGLADRMKWFLYAA